MRLPRSGGRRGGKEALPPGDVVRRLFSSVLSGKSPPAASNLVAPNVAIYGAYPEDIRGLASFEKLVRTFRETFHRVTISVDSIAELGEVVVCRWSARAKIAYAWPLPLVDLEIPGAIWILRVRDSQVVEIRPMDDSFEPPPYEGETDDDGPVGSAPPGPRWVPPEPTPKPPRRDPDDGGL